MYNNYEYKSIFIKNISDEDKYGILKSMIEFDTSTKLQSY